ncbi:hypothetical protein TELCIR_19704 [Teladorsagia circumcincta]|uniref:Uncharacterized protein n=1 Tax=Teladorsagia circumcincta TaxID=45464 RepID=A0A2G9TLK7_TELCI|nr:hypothetical protein TELCIR_19704 [Teladorsagia circumcincta]
MPDEEDALVRAIVHDDEVPDSDGLDDDDDDEEAETKYLARRCSATSGVPNTVVPCPSLICYNDVKETTLKLLYHASNTILTEAAKTR